MKRCLICLLIFTTGIVKYAIAQSPKLYLVQAAHVAAVKKASAGNTMIQQEISMLAKEADKLLGKRILSVVDKKMPTPCGSKHEYMSMASYFWPDPLKPDGLPYIRKDGERNPDNSKVTDHKGFDEVIRYVTTLSWAYYFTIDEKYATKGVELLKFWFVDTATRMLPNLNHAQVIMGVDTGRGIGIIDIHLVPELLDAISLLQTLKAMKKTDMAAIHEWFGQFLVWLDNSKNGIEESKTKNNHKTWYDNLVASIALFCGKTDRAKTIFNNAKILLAAQIQPDGKQPLELERTNSLSYATFNLRAWFMLALHAENAGIDIWHYETNTGQSIRKALDYILPYAMDKKKWEYQQIGTYEERDLHYLMTLASDKFKDENYKIRAEKLKKYDTPLQSLLYKHLDVK